MMLSFAWACYALGLLSALVVGLRWVLKNDPSYRQSSAEGSSNESRMCVRTSICEHRMSGAISMPFRGSHACTDSAPIFIAAFHQNGPGDPACRLRQHAPGPPLRMDAMFGFW